jgi:hypothetical protein
VVATLLLLGLAGCSNHWGWPIAALPYDAGWRPLPIKAWVLNDGVSAEAISICPRESCAQQGFAALLSFEGERAAAMERALRGDDAGLARAFEKPAASDATTGGTRTRPQTKTRTTTRVARFSAQDADGLVVTITAAASGKSAATAILFGRRAGRLVVALAVGADAGKARQDAAATWQSR